MTNTFMRLKTNCFYNLLRYNSNLSTTLRLKPILVPILYIKSLFVGLNQKVLSGGVTLHKIPPFDIHW